MALLFADENFPTPVVQYLHQIGHDVVTMQQLDLAGQAISDEEVLRLATAQGRCLLTLNRKDFIKLHSASAMHSGILICTFDPDFAALAQRIDTCLGEQEHIEGGLLRVQRPNV